eukprot:1149881-Pelagomonas_calceolata.AAC.3
MLNAILSSSYSADTHKHFADLALRDQRQDQSKLHPGAKHPPQTRTVPGHARAVYEAHTVKAESCGRDGHPPPP